ncbi:MAG TPA: SpoIIE family protein phosphatase [Acidimicrobiia bacterium]|nr:SpoIIE family protein phosphatase [Acidimicrobiia bacterium]
MRSRLAMSEKWRSVIADTLASLGVAAWEWHADTDELWWSENLGPLMGREAGFTPSGFTAALTLFEDDPKRPVRPAELLRLMETHDGPVEAERRGILPDGSKRWMLQRYSAIKDGDGATVGVFGVVIDIDERKRREREEALLHEAAQSLAKSLAVDETLASIARLVVPDLADWCVVELIEDGRLQTAVNAHIDPEKVRWAKAIQAEYPQDMSSPVGSPNVVRTGESEIYPEITDDMLVSVAAGDDRKLELLRSVGYRSAMIVPLLVRDEALGAITMVKAESADSFDLRSLHFAERLASHMSIALDNAGLHRKAETRTIDLARLQRATTELAQAAGVDQVAWTAVDSATNASEAAKGALILSDESSPIVVAQRGFEDVHIIGLEEAMDASRGPAAATIADGIARFIASREELIAAFPEAGDVDAVLGDGAAAYLPVRGRAGVVGVLVLAYRNTFEFTADKRETLLSLAYQAGVALDRAKLLAHHRHISAMLQAGLQPPRLPEIKGIASEAMYLPAGSADMGGDWYDLFEAGDGSIVAVIGDVVGHGIPAVADAARMRHVLSGYLFEGHGPGEALRLANRMLFGLIKEERRMATAAIVVIDPERHTAVTARAGHPPVIVRKDGMVSLLEGHADLPLGFDADADWPEETVDLVPDTLLLMYTDGWIDYPGSDAGERLESLRAMVATVDSDPAVVLEVLEQGFADHDQRDDAAAMVLIVD